MTKETIEKNPFTSFKKICILPNFKEENLYFANFFQLQKKIFIYW